MPQAMSPVLPRLRTQVLLAGDRLGGRASLSPMNRRVLARGCTAAPLPPSALKSPKVVPSKGACAASLACTRGVGASTLTLARGPSYTEQ